MLKDSVLVVIILAHLGMGNYHEIVRVCQSVCVPVCLYLREARCEVNCKNNWTM